MADIKDILTVFQRGAIGLSIDLGGKGSMKIDSVHVSRVKKQVVIKTLLPESIEIKQAIESNSSQYPIYITLSGKGILHKVMDSDNLDDNQDWLAQILPQADENDFYLQTLSVKGNKVLVSVIRKAQLDGIIEQIIDSGQTIGGVFLGSGIIVLIRSLLIEKEISNIKINGLELFLNTEGLVSVKHFQGKNEPNAYEIDDLELRPNQLLAFSSAMRHFLSLAFFTPMKLEVIDHSLKNFKEKRMIRQAGLIFAGITLIVLSLNSILFFQYQNDVNALEGQMIQNNVLLEKVERLQDEIDAKKEYLSKHEMTTGQIAFYSDQIASIIPSSILLNEINIYPEFKKKSNKDATVYDFNSIHISGFIRINTQINDFINDLRKFTWINDIKLDSFEKTKKSGESLFTIQITLI